MHACRKGVCRKPPASCTCSEKVVAVQGRITGFLGFLLRPPHLQLSRALASPSPSTAARAGKRCPRCTVIHFCARYTAVAITGLESVPRLKYRLRAPNIGVAAEGHAETLLRDKRQNVQRRNVRNELCILEYAKYTSYGSRAFRIVSALCLHAAGMT